MIFEGEERRITNKGSESVDVEYSTTGRVRFIDLLKRTVARLPRPV